MGMNRFRVTVAVAPLAAAATAVVVLAYPATATVGVHRVSTPNVVKVKTRTVAPYGTIFTNRHGHSLYLFKLDSKGVSRCTGPCTAEWHPLIVPKGDTVSGIAGIGTIRRPSGKRQAAWHHRGLYAFAGDSSAGQVNGEGIAGDWFVATPHGFGHPTTSPTPTTTDSSSPTPTATDVSPTPTDSQPPDYPPPPY